jgi:hypothetical protein
VIADLGVHHVEGLILEEGHTAQRLSSDYGYDLVVWTFDDEGYAEPGAFYMQLKAMESMRESGQDYLFDVDIRDYNLWVREELPVFLILYDATRRRAFWLDFQHYFNAARRPKRGAKSIRVHVPKRQVVNRRAIATMRELKFAAIHRERREGYEAD